ncbi:MAG: serine/threonine-protein kinase [Pirellulaceae bacterium]
MSQVSPQAASPNGPDINLSGQQLGDFLLLRRLGRGGMADVYLAEQRSLRRQVAVKILRAELARDPQYVSRFKFEAQAAARLVHANIVQVFNVGELDGLQFIAQEYVKGQNLKQYLQRNGAVDVPVAVHLLSQVAAALARAAEAGVTHRDIKPENILIGLSGEAKVADFGLARVRDDAHRNHQTQIDVTMGTPLYMSPEQVEGRKVDPRSDLYSLGVTAYEMLAGRPPFEGGNAISVAIRHFAGRTDRDRGDPSGRAASLERVDPASHGQLPRGSLSLRRRVAQGTTSNRLGGSRRGLGQCSTADGNGGDLIAHEPSRGHSATRTSDAA